MKLNIYESGGLQRIYSLLGNIFNLEQRQHVQRGDGI